MMPSTITVVPSYVLELLDYSMRTCLGSLKAWGLKLTGMIYVLQQKWLTVSTVLLYGIMAKNSSKDRKFFDRIIAQHEEFYGESNVVGVANICMSAWV